MNSTQPAAPSSSRAWYGDSVANFLTDRVDRIIGELVAGCEFAVLPTQRDAWAFQIRMLQNVLVSISGSIFFEFSIPRMGRRIDVVLLVGPIVFALQFKIGEADFDRAAIEQVWDYGLDLKNFHEASHTVSIVPVLIATEAEGEQTFTLFKDDDGVFRPLSIDRRHLRPLIDYAIEQITGEQVDAAVWMRSPYRPTPTIIEAARTLYAEHTVEALARYDAGAKNLRETSQRIELLMDEAAAQKRKIICFVTGVPGAGKTLVGLNVATRHRRETDDVTNAVFLSGNGPLVAVLREALTRDEVVRRKAAGEKVRKGEVRERVKAFIQNVHHFRDEALLDPAPPFEHVVIFDEAQRA